MILLSLISYLLPNHSGLEDSLWSKTSWWNSHWLCDPSSWLTLSVACLVNSEQSRIKIQNFEPLSAKVPRRLAVEKSISWFCFIVIIIIMAIILTNSLLVAAGIVSHLAYFNRGEHHMYGARYVQIFLTLYVIAVAIIVQINGCSISRALIDISSIAIFYLAGIYTSLLAYRVFFCPLSRFPGPFGARISNFWFSSQLTNFDAYKRVLQLHADYGDFLRIGSNDLSIIHPKAVNAIYGPGSKCRKADWYDLYQPMVSLQTTRHQVVHDKRRRIWSAAFSDKALRGYQDRIKVYQDKLIARIASFGDERVNVTKWFNLYSFDVMGDLAFGTSFEMLESNEEHWAIKLLKEAMEPLGYLFPTWFLRAMIPIPKLLDDWWKFIGFCSQLLDTRMKVRCVKSSSPNFYWLRLDRYEYFGYHVYTTRTIRRYEAHWKWYENAERRLSAHCCSRKVTLAFLISVSLHWNWSVQWYNRRNSYPHILWPCSQPWAHFSIARGNSSAL